MLAGTIFFFYNAKSCKIILIENNLGCNKNDFLSWDFGECLGF
jgi:hypothetical protein